MIIDIYLDECKRIIQSSKKIGKTYENKSTILKFHLKNEMVDKELYLDIEKPNGKKYRSTSLTIIDDIAEFIIINSLLDEIGIIKIEPILQNNDGYVLKYPTIDFEIVDSINAIQSIEEEQPDFVSQCQDLINLIDTTGDGSSFLSNDGSYKEVSSGTVDYEELINKPITKIINMDKTNIIYLRNLESGTYILQGYFKFNNLISSSAIVPYETDAKIVNTGSKTYIQLFFSYNNQLQYYEIDDTETYFKKTIKFNDLVI